jgi:prepilin-type N-terminal cleavage/methylation domain-containing protein
MPIEFESFAPRRTSFLRHRSQRGFTLVEVLAALLFMAILIPATMHGVAVSSRAGILGQRKSTAMRIAERVLDEQILTGQVTTGPGNGSIIDGDVTYPWTLKVDSWSEDAMSLVTVLVSFEVQGSIFDVGASTLYDPTAGSTTTASTP